MNKKIFFYSNHREDDLSIGITKKVHSQIKTFKKLGYKVFYSAYINKGIGIFNNENKLIYYKKCIRYDGSLGHIVRRIDNLLISAKFIRHHHFDIGYYRFHFWDLYYLKLVKAIKKYGGKVCIEAHCYPYETDSSLSMQIIYFIDRIYNKYAFKYVDLVAGITESDEKIWGCNTVKIENGINFEDCHVRTVLVNNESTINLVCVANEQKTHGVERIIRGLFEYYKDGTESIKLWLVGEYLQSTQNLINELKLQKYIFLVGKKHGDELYYFYNHAHLGVGPLALYLGNYHRGECLKTKEYMSVGLPFITSASNDAPIASHRSVLVFEEDDKPIDINKIVNFVRQNPETQEQANELHKYAVNNYNWESQIKKILLGLGEDIL